jgi:hypothetical protein
MSNQIGDVDEIAQFVSKAASFENPRGVSVTVEFENGSVMSRDWGAVASTAEPTTPERSETEIREAWAEVADDEWQKFQSMAAEHGVHSLKRGTMVGLLADMGVMPEDDPSVETSEQAVFAAPRTSSKALATAGD